ncbi:glycosyltransferase family 2 protein [Shewanella nanhaiensis]|uniref:Glycosyltransferase n=1 Tax=Shewanella nanhaiensis TaxID=2864872 RepID=A0ABS7E6A7_9GAMM|nr:glycosyltransferase [Shewanella nanhaiensis]MBW8185208.1 glycosyltransferase [Shewanella nanhaiensis]
MMNPLVSILVPVFNHSKYIEECLNSIVNTDYPNLELVLCDDGSTDNSVEIINSWLNKHRQLRHVFLTQKNMGVCKTLNRLITASSGEYIVICASDDSLSSDSITVRYDYLINNPSKHAVIGDASVFDENSKFVNISAMKSLFYANYNNLNSNIVRELVLRWSVVGPTIMLKRKVYDDLGLYDEGLLIEDREFYLRILKQNKLGFIPVGVANYRIHNGNASRKSISSRLKVSEQVAISNLKHCSDFDPVCNFFLMSHKVDLLWVKMGTGRLTFYSLFIFRAIRRFVFSPFRFF